MNNLNYLHVWKTIKLGEIDLFAQWKGNIYIPFRSTDHFYSGTQELAVKNQHEKVIEKTNFERKILNLLYCKM